MDSLVLSNVRTAAISGIEASAVWVEVDVSAGLPSFAMVGLPDPSVRESRDRVRSAIRNSGFEFPPNRITVNLAPADVRKAGASFDLPIALGILAASGIVARPHVPDLFLLGELALDGTVHPVRGVLPIALAARRDGMTGLLLPVANAVEASIVAGLRLLPVSSLSEAVEAVNHPVTPEVTAASLPASAFERLSARATEPADFCDVAGQHLARRAVEVAAAGDHNLLFVGPPGSGKTMMARRIPGILPPLTFDEALEVTAVHSVAGTLPRDLGLMAARPFRSPHHTISYAALAGGGAQARPGEISLAHHGVLFLDEMLEFARHVLEVLRQPLEDGWVTVARAARTVVFPARFMLVGAMNPCPCGFRGDPRRPCRCGPRQVASYRQRLSGPLRDRIDITVEVSALPLDALASVKAGESSRSIRGRVVAARKRQADRYHADRVCTNAELTPGLVRQYCGLDGAGRRLLESATERLALSARAYDRIRKVARTIADLEGAEAIKSDHVAEAIQYRLPDD